ncbi:MAG: AraC family transcriptional regulator [Devosia sp.]|jgi:AraC-like DNA-binding protein|nr:AraC family transcriptional regulator [Devosia sp.]RYE49485.1 MAG: helix-turn-helix domain-containing protein [Hyphomicrobiales bacterium]
MNHAITNLTAHVPRHAFTTADVVPELQAEAWQSIVPFFSIEPRRSRELGYLGRITAWNLGSLVLARATSQASVFTRDDRLLRADGFDHWTLLAPSSGTIVADAAVAGAGGCQARALHSVDHGSNSDIDALFLVVPRDLCHPHASELDRLHGANLPAGPGRLLVDYLRSLYRQLPLLDLDQLPMLVDATRNMVIACAAPSRNAMEQAMPAIQATQMERAKQFIRDNLLQASLDTRELCRYLGMSRSSLYRLFEPLGGVARYIRSARLLDAHRALSTASDTRPVYAIARERGFDDPSEFSRAFKHQFGYSPTEARSEWVPAPHPHKAPAGAASSLAEVIRLIS